VSALRGLIVAAALLAAGLSVYLIVTAMPPG
jgi:hypothetical protein